MFNINKLKRGSVVSIGVFDGVHIGHKKIIADVVRAGRALRLNSVVVTFNPHPLKVIDPKHSIPSIVSLHHRLRLIESLGVDAAIVLNFTRSVSRLTPECFVKNILISRLHAKEVIVGENFYFGKDAKADAGALKAIGKRSGLKVRIIGSVKKSGTVVSSSVIRQLILKGALREASGLLGRPVSVLGTVVAGSKFARVLGYPTANINPHHEAIPPFGVYAVRARFAGKLYKGLLNIGVRPTFFSSRDEEPTIEVHIFGFHKRIYGKEIEVLFVRKLRAEKKFRTREALIRQIDADALQARRILG